MIATIAVAATVNGWKNQYHYDLMYVRCPYCETVFQASEAQLSAQQTMVCCGVCEKIFNWSWNLLDELPLLLTEQADPGVVPVNPAINPLQGSTTTAAIADASTVQRVASDKPDTENGVAAQAATTDDAVLPSTEEPVGDTETRTPSTSVVTPQAVVVPAFYSELRARDPSINIAVLPKHGRRSAWLWLLALLTAAVLLLWQFNYFFFDTLTQNQRLRPMLDRACEVIGCQLPVRYNPALLVLFNTRILSHPADPRAVRVISELQNHATFSQPAPLLQLSLSDPRGVVVARRSFPPSAYLPVGQGSTIAAGGSREVVLDLASPGKSAVGFELKIVATDRSSP